MKTLTSLQNFSLTVVKSTAFLIFGIYSFSEIPQAQARCRDGGYPYLQCEIVNGRKVCVRRCGDSELRAKQKQSRSKHVSRRHKKLY